MRKTSLAMVIGTLLFVNACGNEAKKEADDKQLVLTSESSKAEREAYALGASMGMFAKGRLDMHSEMDLALDEASLNAGFKDAMQGTLQFSEEEIQNFAKQSDIDLRAAQDAVAKAKSDVDAEATKAEGKTFLAENAKREEVVMTESGLQYEVITKGNGAAPTAADSVKVHYKGTLIDGTEFDSSFKRNKPISFALNAVIKGWTEGLQLMQEGATHRLYIPSDLGYGGQKAGQIPPHSVLIFDVELIKVNPED